MPKGGMDNVIPMRTKGQMVKTGLMQTSAAKYYVFFLSFLSIHYIVKDVFNDHTFDHTWERNDGNVMFSQF